MPISKRNKAKEAKQQAPKLSPGSHELDDEKPLALKKKKIAQPETPVSNGVPVCTVVCVVKDKLFTR